MRYEKFKRRVQRHSTITHVEVGHVGGYLLGVSVFPSSSGKRWTVLVSEVSSGGRLFSRFFTKLLVSGRGTGGRRSERFFLISIGFVSFEIRKWVDSWK